MVAGKTQIKGINGGGEAEEGPVVKLAEATVSGLVNSDTVATWEGSFAQGCHMPSFRVIQPMCCIEFRFLPSCVAKSCRDLFFGKISSDTPAPKWAVTPRGCDCSFFSQFGDHTQPP